jgi:hypothetical protein
MKPITKLIIGKSFLILSCQEHSVQVPKKDLDVSISKLTKRKNNNLSRTLEDVSLKIT